MARVLVVEGDAETRRAVEGYLRVDGHAADLAATGAEGLRRGREATADLVIADLRLPDIDGLSLCKRLALEGFGRPFVLTTACASATTAFEAGRLGVAAYLEKPVSPEELRRVVRVHTRVDDASSAAVAPGDGGTHTRRALRLIDDRYHDAAFDIHVAAEVCGVTREHLARVIGESTGRTFTQLLHARRMREACRLLTDTPLRIKEIYQQVGVSRASDFDHAFKKMWGVSPSTYRRISTAGVDITVAQLMSPPHNQSRLPPTSNPQTIRTS